jgi:hypothetical protein
MQHSNHRAAVSVIKTTVKLQKTNQISFQKESEIMNYHEFCEEIRLTVQPIIGSGYTVSAIKIDKLNGVALQSLAIQKNNEPVIPNIYLEEYYNKYQLGRSIEALAIDIISCYFQADKSSDLSVPLLTDFDTAKGQIFVKLINYDKNKELLETMPYIKWFDLAIVFSVLIKQNSEGIGSFYVKNDLMERWEVDINTIYSHAINNTPRLFGSNVRLMDDIIKELIIKDFNQVEDNDVFDIMMEALLSEQNASGRFHKMYVASNSLGVNGAAWLLYKDEIRSLSNKLNANLYVLPSSIHEVIIISANDQLKKDQLLNMVKEVNNTQVPVHEVLSDNVYFFNRETEKIYPLA